MEKCLLSVDWDYFIKMKKDYWSSCIENDRNLVDLWYKRYILEKLKGRDIQKLFELSREHGIFWNKINEHFQFTHDIKAYVSDSHALSYKIAKENNCKIVYLFDSHADLGYGGLSSLNFEVNCSNWLGKLLKDKIINEANIIYSTYTLEKPEFFRPMNNILNIRYCNFNDLNKNIKVSVIHICRSGAWTPPWLDKMFAKFIDEMGIPYEIVDCPERKWDPRNMSFSDQVNYMLA